MNGFNSNIFKFYIRSSFVRSYNHNIQKLIKQVNNNLEHIDNIEIKINNPNKINVKRTSSYYCFGSNRGKLAIIFLLGTVLYTFPN